FVPYRPPPSSKQPPVQSFKPSPSNRALSPQNQQYQQRYPLQRQSTSGSQNSLGQQTSAGRPPLGTHPQSRGPSTSHTSINHIPSGGRGQYSPSPPLPTIQVRPSTSQDSYVARLRRTKATVWSARGQREDLDRSNSKEDKYNKRPKRPVARVPYPHSCPCL